MQLDSLKRGARRASNNTVKPKTIVMVFDRLEASEGKASFFHGFDAITREPVVVRLNTIEEGLAVVGRLATQNREAALAKLKQQYVGSGEQGRPRPAHFVTVGNKVHCEKGGTLAFTRCLPNEDGSFRAHWAETLAPTAGTACDLVHANLSAEKFTVDGVVTHQVVADIVRPEKAVELTPEIAVPTVLATMASQREVNGELIGRSPFAILRLIDKSDGSQPEGLEPVRISPLRVPVEVVDHDGGGETRIVYRVASAEDSLKHLMAPGEDVKESRDMWAAKAMIYGLSKEPGYPTFKGAGADQTEALHQIVDAVRNGTHAVELIPGERIAAGKATKSGIVKQAYDQNGAPFAYHPIHMNYSPRDERGYVKARYFIPTYLTTEMSRNGSLMMTKFLAADHNTPKTTLRGLATGIQYAPEAGSALDQPEELAQADDAMPFDPTAINPDAEAGVDARLEQSAAALDAEFF